MGSPLLDETRAILITCMTLYMLVLVSVPRMQKIWDDCLPSCGAGASSFCSIGRVCDSSPSGLNSITCRRCTCGSKGSWSGKNTFLGRAVRSQDGLVSDHDRSHQRLGPNDVHGSCQVIGQDRESHLGGYFWSVLARKCVAPMRAFMVPNGCSTVSRRTRMA